METLGENSSLVSLVTSHFIFEVCWRESGDWEWQEHIESNYGAGGKHQVSEMTGDVNE